MNVGEDVEKLSDAGSGRTCSIRLGVSMNGEKKTKKHKIQTNKQTNRQTKDLVLGQCIWKNKVAVY